MFDLSLQNILHSNLFNFILMVIILYSLTASFIKKNIADANEGTVTTVQNSVKKKEIALKNLETVKQNFAKIPEETAEIEKIAQNTISSLQKKSEEDTEKIKQEIEDSAEKTIQNELYLVVSDLTKETAEKSVQTALTRIKEKLGNDNNLHDKLIEQAIEELDKF